MPYLLRSVNGILSLSELLLRCLGSVEVGQDEGSVRTFESLRYSQAQRASSRAYDSAITVMWALRKYALL